MARIGTCDICGLQNMELSRGEVSGLETWSCADECPACAPLKGEASMSRSELIEANRSRQHCINKLSAENKHLKAELGPEYQDGHPQHRRLIIP